MSGHTPGQWFLRGDDPCLVVCEAEYFAIADCAGGTERDEANARLIAAAPDLLEALIECLKSGQGETDSREAYLPPVIRDMARAAIDKAAHP